MEFMHTDVEVNHGNLWQEEERDSTFYRHHKKNLIPARWWCKYFVKFILIPAFIILLQGGCTSVKPDKIDYTISLPTRSFSPAEGIPENLAPRIDKVLKSKSAQNTQVRAHLLIQFFDTPADLREVMQRQDIYLLEPVNPYTWRASVGETGAKLLFESKAVRWADIPLPADRSPGELLIRKPPLYNVREDGLFAYRVVFHRDVTLTEVDALATPKRASCTGFRLCV